MSGLPGLDLATFTAWFDDTVPGQRGELSAELVEGGKSNLTYAVTDGARSWIVRRPPLGHVLATAHDMSREYRVMAALQNTAVPVPKTYALCEDGKVLGAPFYVMEKVEGTPYRYATELEELGPHRTRAISAGMIDTLAALHQVDPNAVGLGDFGRPDGFLARQVRRWRQQLDASNSRELPAADELHSRLGESIPEQSPAGIVHGDYRLDNIMVDATDHLAAVIDWEMSTVGDPLTDLALLVFYQRVGTIENVVADASSAAGFLTESELLDRYSTATGRDLSSLGFYLGLAAFKLAVVLEGIHYRYIHGQTVGQGFEQVGELVPSLLDAGLTALMEH